MPRFHLAASALAAVTILMTAAGTHAKAQGFEFAYCTSGGWATDNICRFNTFEECMTFVQGVGGSCTRNPRATVYSNPHPYPPPARGSLRSRR